MLKKSIKICFLLLCSISYFLSIYYVPSELFIFKGEEHEFSFHVPFNAAIENVTALSVNQKAVEDNIKIDLSKPFTIKSDKSGELDVKLMAFGFIPMKSIRISVIPDRYVTPLGMAVGIKINTEGVMVLGTGAVRSEDNGIVEPSRGILKSGDLILKANGLGIDTKEQLIDAVEANAQSEISFTVKRNDDIFTTAIKPAKSSEDKKYKIGAWVRDSTQGIGTLTYVNPETKMFGALGHGILDVDTKEMTPLKSGEVMKAEITSIKKGKKGSPGELIGNIYKKQVLGHIIANTSLGVYGRIFSENEFPKEVMPIALKQEVHEGPAVIRSNILEGEMKEYSVYIQSVNILSQDNTKGMVIKITDPRLLDQTNGIVQGMSGSPIIQDGKIVGAITHVFVQDPERGYGVFIENMLNQEKLIGESLS